MIAFDVLHQLQTAICCAHAFLVWYRACLKYVVDPKAFLLEVCCGSEGLGYCLAAIAGGNSRLLDSKWNTGVVCERCEGLGRLLLEQARTFLHPHDHCLHVFKGLPPSCDGCCMGHRSLCQCCSCRPADCQKSCYMNADRTPPGDHSCTIRAQKASIRRIRY